jgi:DNA mismatch endonuclease Vsr
MVDIVSPQKRSEMMAGIKGKNTKPELVVRRLLHAEGFRFRLHRKDLPGRPDIVLPRFKTAIFVNGCFWQPKSIAEYIQATSRVGRGKVPGLVVSIYNANKSRDRSRFENFQNWHRSLYRDVEATGVTPFAERARERALHAAFVICARYLVAELREGPADVEKFRDELECIIERIVARAKESEQSAAETEAVEEDLRSFLQGWIDNSKITEYWEDHKRKSTLLISAEEAAKSGNRGRNTWPRPTPNSLRSVEASTAFSLRNARF